MEPPEPPEPRNWNYWNPENPRESPCPKGLARLWAPLHIHVSVNLLQRQKPTSVAYPLRVFRHFPPGHFPPDLSPRTKSSIYAALSAINPTSIYRPNYFHQSHFHFNKGRFSSNVRVVYINFWANFVNF